MSGGPRPRRVAWGAAPALLLGLLALAGPAEARTLHVAPEGDDGAAGTAARPLASLAAALARADEDADPAEIVLHAGTYAPVTVGDRSDRKGPARPPLLIRAAEAQGGGFEAVVFDAGARVASARPVVGAPGVHRLDAPWKGRDEPQMWERDTRTRYVLLADLAAVGRQPGSFTVTGEGFLFHTSDGRPPEAHEVGRTLHASGIVVWRSDVTLRGLRAVNAAAAGIMARGSRVVVEDCVVENSRRAVSLAGEGARVRRLRATDVGGGVYVTGDDVWVEDSRLEKRHDGFVWSILGQDQVGIQFYHPARRAVARGNLSVGFESCIFIKSRGGARIERNTCVEGGASAFGVGGGWEHAHTAVLDNVVVGFAWPLRQYEQVRRGTPVEGNCFWGSRDEQTLTRTFAHLERVGGRRPNVVADPQFAAPAAGDYRLAGGPCARRGAAGPAGALPALEPGASDRRPPTVALALEAPAVLVSAGLAFHAERDPRLGGAPGRLDADRLPAVSEWLTSEAEVVLRIDADDAGGRSGRLRLRACGAPEAEEPLTSRRRVRLPAGSAPCVLEVRVADAAGNWSEPAAAIVRRTATGPRILSGPHVQASRHGAVVSFESDGPARVAVETDASAAIASVVARAWIPSADDLSPEALAGRRIRHHVVLSAPREPGRYRLRLVLRDALGRETLGPWAPLPLEGPPRELFVAPDGRDVEGAGRREAPWRTLQFALDRALPGDRVELAPGLYPGQTRLLHGGTEGAPIRVAAGIPGSAILDGGKRVETVLDLVEAPFVSFDGLEIRWAVGTMIRAERSPGLALRRSRIWGDLWFGRSDVGSVQLEESPGARFEHDVVFQTKGLLLRDSPGARLVHNTIFANAFYAVFFLRSAQDSVLRNNSLAFNGNEIFAFRIESPRELDRFDSDYNNLGTHLVAPKEAWLAEAPGLEERLRGRRNLPNAYGTLSSKRLVNVNDGRTLLFSLEEWRKFSGQDRHSIFADPRYVDVEGRDLRLHPDSPNLGAGEAEATIGALGVAP